MVLPARILSSPSGTLSARPPNKGRGPRGQKRGLWRRDPRSRDLPTLPSPKDALSFCYDDGDNAISASSRSKRQRTGSVSSNSSPVPTLISLSEVAGQPSSNVRPSRSQSMIAAILDAQRPKTDKGSVDLEDWQDLKELFAEATEQYERDDTLALTLLRAVIQECHRFFTFYADPSVVFVSRASSHRPVTRSTIASTSRHGRSARNPERQPSTTPPEESQPPQHELPTSFHAILGIALFLMGNLFAQDSSFALADEPNTPTVYWLGALDVFETGENIPSRTNGSLPDAEDWRMSIVWGRTLMCLAEAVATASDALPVTEPQWPRHSIFHDIATLRPPVTRRTSLATASPNALMVLAMDQLSRGIFHMPHPQHAHAHSHIFARFAPTPSASSVPETLTPASVDSLGFSRPKELFTIASEVIGVAECLRDPDERRYWAVWADSVFNQMKMEADMGEWRARITHARGRCWLIAGTVRAEELEDALERGEDNVLESQTAVVARESLQKAISFFERAKGSASAQSSGPALQDLQPLYAEALVSLANLTIEEDKRESLYSRAQAEGGPSIALALEQRNNAPTNFISFDDDHIVYMDES